MEVNSGGLVTRDIAPDNGNGDNGDQAPGRTG
jgi:hypothetical protein